MLYRGNYQEEQQEIRDYIDDKITYQELFRREVKRVFKANLLECWDDIKNFAGWLAKGFKWLGKLLA
jgi:hypothetical protein